MINVIYKLIDKIGRFYNILILSPSYRSFGNCSEVIYFGLLHCVDKNKKLLIIQPFDSFFFKKITKANRYLYQLDHDLIIKPSFLINFLCSFMMSGLAGYGFIYSKIRKLLAKIFNLPIEFYNNDELSDIATQHFGWDDIWGVYEKTIFTEKKLMELEKKYIPPDLPVYIKESSNQFIKQHAPEAIQKKWVTLHVLDNTINNYARGANIDDYNQAIEYLISQDFHIFRIGGRNTPRYKDLPGITDLAHLDHDNSLDLFLIQNADFHIDVQSGPHWTGHLFNKDVFMTNSVDWSISIPRKKGNFYIMKKFINKSTNKRIPISKFFEHDFNFQVHTNSCADKDYFVEDNSGLEILIALKEFLKFKESDKGYTEAQEKFDRKKNSWLKKELLQEDLIINFAPKGTSNFHRKRIYMMSLVSGTMSNFFLEENWE